MKLFSKILILLSITISFSFVDKDVIIEYNAKELYNNGFDELKLLESNEIKYLVNQFDNVSGWDDFQYMVFSYPLDTTRKNYGLQRNQYINEFLSRTRFYSFPIKLNTLVLDCFLLTSTITTNGQNYRLLKVFYLDKENPNSIPVKLLSFCEYFDGLSSYSENSDCRFYTNREITSVFSSTREALDLKSYNDEPSTPSIETIRMKLIGNTSIEIINK